jgi:hypothetical protein
MIHRKDNQSDSGAYGVSPNRRTMAEKRGQGSNGRSLKLSLSLEPLERHITMTNVFPGFSLYPL